MAQEEECHKKRNTFVKYFVQSWENRFSEYLVRLHNQIPKEGKWAGAANSVIEVTSGATEAIGGYAKAAVHVATSVFSETISSGSKSYNRKELKKLTEILYFIENNPEFARKQLVAAGVDIFLRFEAQLVKVIVDNSWERALRKVAEDAADRAIDYFRNNNKNVALNAENISTAVINGSSKAYHNTSNKFPRLRKGHTVILSTTGKEWNTSEIFDRTGLAIIDCNGSITKYNKKQGDQIENYGFHLEYEEGVSERHSMCNAPLAPYDNILQWNCKDEYTKEILESINTDDPTLMESRLTTKLDQILEGIKEPSRSVQVKRPVFFINKLPVRTYIKRTDEFTNISKDIDSNVVVVYGLGGVGKSELLLNYALECAEKYDRNLIWLNATTTETLKSSFQLLANDFFENFAFHDKNGQEKSLDNIGKEIYESLTTEKSLIIFDNAQELSAIRNLLPSPLRFKENRPHFLVSSPVKWSTSRIHNISSVHLKDFSPDQARAYIQQALCDNSQNSDVDTLAKEIGFSPLALAHATSYIMQTREDLAGRRETYTISDYLHEFYQAPEVLLDFEDQDDLDDKTFKTVSRTLQITLDVIKNKSARNMEAIDMIKILSYFSSNDIPEEVFQYGTEIKKNKQDVIKISSILVKYSIVHIENGLLNVHGLVQRVVRHRLKNNNMEFKYLDKSLKALKFFNNEATEDTSKKKMINLCRPHKINVWNYACNHRELIDEYVVNRDNYDRPYSFLHNIIVGCTYDVIEKIIQNIDTNDLERLLNCDLIPDEQALHVAAFRGDKEIAKLLYQHGAKLQKNKENKLTPLLTAAVTGNLETFKYIIEIGASLEEKQYGMTALHAAAYGGHLEIVKYCLQHIPVNVIEDYGMTPLHCAAAQGHLHVVKYLVEDHGADTNIYNKYGATPFYEAIRNNMIDVVKYLSPLYIKDCAEGSACNTACSTAGNEMVRKGWSPLHWAARFGSGEVCRYLTHDIFTDIINQKNYDGCTPVFEAFQDNNLEKIKLFVDNGADLTIQDNYGSTVLHAAANGGHLEIVKYCLQHIPVNVIDNAGWTPLHCAAGQGHLHVVKYIVEDHGADTNIYNIEGATPLYGAIHSSMIDVVKYLSPLYKKDCAEGSACSTACNTAGKEMERKGWSPLHWAARFGSEEVCRYLTHDIFRDIINQKENYGGTPVFCAVCDNNLEKVKLFVDNGADLTIQNNTGDTVLQVAAWIGSLELVKYCLQHIPVNVISDHGYTPLHCAAAQGHLHVVKCLVEDHGADTNIYNIDGATPFYEAIHYSMIEVVKYLSPLYIKDCAEGRACSTACNTEGKEMKRKGWSPLHWAASFGSEEVCRYLTHDIFTDIINQKNNDGVTPVFKAVLDNNIEKLKLFVDNGADLTIQNNTGDTVLQVAAWIGSLELVEYCLQHVPVNVINDDGWTPLHYAAGEGHLHVVKYLVEDHGADTNIYNINGATPFYEAIRNNMIDVVKYLSALYIKDRAEGRACSTVCNTEGKDVERKGWSPLHWAARFGSEEVCRYLTHHVFTDIINHKDNDGVTPIFYAVVDNNLEKLKLFVNNGAGLTIQGDDSTTVLHMAAYGGHLELVEYCLQHIPVNVIDKDGDTPLHCAAAGSHLHVVKYLVEDHGADTNIYNINGATPFYEAIQNSMIEVVKYLSALYIKDCAEGSACNTACSTAGNEMVRKGWSPLHWAARFGSEEVCRYLTHDIFTHIINKKTNDGFTPIFLAVTSNNLEKLKLFVDNGADLTIQKNNGWTVLHESAYWGMCNIVQYIISKDLKLLNVCSNEGLSVVHCAAYKGHLEVLQCLPDNLVDYDQADNTGCTPIQYAAAENHFAIVKYLAENKKVNCNWKDNNKNNIMHCAADGGSTEMVQYLMSKTDKELIIEGNNDGFFPLDWAIEKGNIDLVKYLLDVVKVKLSARSLLIAIQNGHLEIAKYLLTEKRVNFLESEGGVLNLDAADNNGKSALQLAARQGYTDIVKMLIEMGANIELKNIHDSLLHQAVARGVEETVKYVLEQLMKCPDFAQIVNCQDGEGDTPLMWAIEAGPENIVDILLLPRYQCDLTMRNNNGETALDWAVKLSNDRIINAIRMSMNKVQGETSSTNNGAESINSQL